MATVGQSNLERALELRAAGRDLDQIYDEIYAGQIDPCQFRSMVYAESVKPEVIERCQGGNIDRVFAEEYPEFVSRHVFREVMVAALKRQAAEADEQAETEGHPVFHAENLAE